MTQAIAGTDPGPDTHILTRKSFTVGIEMKCFYTFLLIFISHSAIGEVAKSKLSPCIGDHCLYEHLTDRQFVRQFGKGRLRSDEVDRQSFYRCFYVPSAKSWAEYQFGSHGGRTPELVSVLITSSGICAGTYLSRAPLNVLLQDGKLAMGMAEHEVIRKMGTPARIEVLTSNTRNPIFLDRFGDRAFVYSSEDSVLYGVVYFKETKVVGYRLSVEE